MLVDRRAATTKARVAPEVGACGCVCACDCACGCACVGVRGSERRSRVPSLAYAGRVRELWEVVRLLAVQAVICSDMDKESEGFQREMENNESRADKEAHGGEQSADTGTDMEG